MESKSMKYGDLLLLQSQDFSGAVSSFGFVDKFCFLQQVPGNDLRHTLNSRCLVFQLLPKLNYENMLEFQKLKNTFKKQGQAGQIELKQEDLDLIESLQQKMQTEKDLNERTIEQRNGTSALYGQEVQFKHVSSQMLLKGKRETAEGDRSCYLLELAENGSNGVHFKILPRYKYRQEGDPIVYSDFVLIVNIKLGLHLHISEKPVEMVKSITTQSVNKYLCSDIAPAASVFATKYEVNISTQKSVFQFECFSSQVDQSYLKCGAVVKLMHTELEGLLCSDGIDYTKDGLADVYVRKYKGEDPLERSSAHTFFILESDENTHRGQVCTWRKGDESTWYRLRHLTTRRIVSVVQDSAGQMLSLSRHSHEGATNDDDTLFAFAPTTIETTNKVKEGCIAKIRARTSGHYLATISEEWALAAAARSNELIFPHEEEESISDDHDFFMPLEIDDIVVARRKIVLTAKSQIEDAYQINVVDQEEVQEVEFVMSTVPVLQHFGALFEQRIEPDRAMYLTVEQVLCKLILYCNLSDNRDPYTCEGEPIGRRQKFMRELGVIDLVCNILHYPFEQKMYSLESLRKTELMTKICILGYRLVRLAAKDNRVNELYCAQWMGLFLSHAEKTTQNDNLHPEETLTEILSDNRRLLERQIRPRMIRKFVNLIRRGRDEKYAKLIGSLCTCNNQAITRNQNTISDVIASDTTFTETMMVKLRATGKGIEVEIAEMQTWVRLEAFQDFSETHDDGKVYKYFLALLDLISELAFDRNHQTDALRSYYSFETCFACASNPDVNDTIRSKFVRMMLYLHIDQGDVQPLSLPGYTRIWSELSTEDAFPCSKLALSLPIQEAKKLVFSYLTDLRGVQRANEPTKNELTKQVLLLTKFLLIHGVYITPEELEELVQPLVDILDGTSDIVVNYASVSSTQALAKVATERRQEKTRDKKARARYEVNEGNSVMIECKRIICSVLSIIMTMRVDYQLSLFLGYLKEDDEVWEESPAALGSPAKRHSDSEDELIQVQDLEPLKSIATGRSVFEEPHNLEKPIHLLKLTLDDPLLLITACVDNDLISILMDLMLYGNAEVVREGFMLLLKNFTQYKLTITALQNVQLLENDEAVQTLAAIKERLVTLKAAAENAEVWLGREVSTVNESYNSSFGSDVQVRFTHNSVNFILQFFIGLCSRLSKSRSNITSEPDKEQQSVSFTGLRPPLRRASLVDSSFVFASPRDSDNSKPLNFDTDPEDRIAGVLFGQGNRSNKENQRLLRNLQVYRPVLEIAGHKGIIIGYNQERHRSVLRHCYVFLACFCHRNPQNQELLYEYLEEFIEDLDKDACAGLLLHEIFKNNTELCAKLPAKYIRMIVRQINDMPLGIAKCDLFRTLAVLVKSKDHIFKHNQLEIVSQLASSDMSNVLLIYNNTDSFYALERNIQACVKLYGGVPANVVKQQIDIPVDSSYLIALIDLLSACAEEWNAQAEVICQRILSLPQIGQLYAITELFWPLRNVLMLFFLNVYLDIEFSMQDNEKVLWLFLERINNDLDYIFHNYTRGGRSYNSAIEKAYFQMGDRRANVVDFALHYVYRAIMPTLIEVFMKRGSGLQTENRADLIKSIVHLSGSFHKIAITPQQQQASSHLLKVLSDIEKFRKYLHTEFLDMKEESFSKGQQAISHNQSFELLDTGKAATLMKISRGFLKSQALNEKMESEFHDLVMHMKNIEKISCRAFPDGQFITTTELLRAFISFLCNVSNTDHTQANEIRLVGLKMLRKFIELGNSDQHTPAAEWSSEDWEQCKMSIVSSQNLLTSLQAVHLVISVYTKCKDKILKGECLLFMIAILLGGNKLAQAEFLEQISKSPRNKFLLAIKTTLSTSFEKVRVASQTLIVEGEKRLRERVRDTLVESNNTQQDADSDEQTIWVNDEMVIETIEDKHSQFIQLTQNALRFLQLLCEGHNLSTQKFLREQTQGDVVIPKTFNMVSFVGGVMGMYTKIVHQENISLGFQILDTLTEMTQGPCRANQRELSHPKIVDNCRDLLISLGNKTEKEVHGFDPDEEAIEAISELKSKTASFLLSLLEGEADVEIVSRIASTLDFNMIKERMSYVFKAFVKKEFNRDSSSISLSDIEDRLKKDSFAENVEEGFNLYILMNKLADSSLEAERKREGGSPEQQKAFTFFKEHTGRIEIVVDKVLQRIYFPILPICKHISEPSKVELLEAVNRDTPASKVTDLLTLSTGMIEEMEHTERLSHVYFHPDMEKYLFLRDVCFALSFFINLMILFHYKFTLQVSNYMDPATMEVIDVLGAILIGVSGLCVLMWLILKGSVHVKAKWRERIALRTRNHPPINIITPDYLRELTAKKTWTVLLQRGPDALEFHENGKRNFRFASTKLLYYALSAKMLFGAGQFQVLLLYTLFAGLGIYDPVFFAVVLIDVVYRFPTLTNILKAITINKNQLLMTSMLSTLVTFIYSLWGFYISPEMYYEREIEPWGETMCQSLFQCFLTTLDEGPRLDGGIGNIMEKFSFDDKANYYQRFFLDLSHFLLFRIMFLNIILGTIIDSFAQMREKKKFREADKRNKCFICSIDRSVLDRANGHEKHISEDHNVWHYIYFLVHLKCKDPTEYNGGESYCASLVEKGDIAWVPLHRALCLGDASKNRHEEDNLIEVADTKVRKLSHQMKEISKQIKD